MVLETVMGIVLVLGLVILAGPRLLQRFIDNRLHTEMEAARTLVPVSADPVLANLDPSRPALIYFTADWCAPCRTTQSPIIERLITRFNQTLQVHTVDVVADPDAAQRWGVQSLPRTFVLRPGLTVHAANIGVAAEHLLADQIEEAYSADTSTPVSINREVPSKSSGFKLRIGKQV